MAERTPIPAGAYERLARQLRADMQRKQFLEQMQAARQAEDMKGRHSVGPDERRPTNPDLISNALLAGTLGGAMSAAGLPSVGLRAGLIGGGLTDATLNAGNPEGGAEISGALAAAGALGRHSIPAAIAALGASSSEAAGMPFHSWMKRLNSLNKVEPTALHVNPTRAELLGMLKDARETYPTSPTVRLLRDQRSNDVYGVEGSSILHDDMRRHLGFPYETTPGAQGNTLPDLESELMFLQSLPKLAGGGAIKRLGKAAMSAFDDLRPSSVAPQGALSVVKPKGGNWLAGSVEDALSELKYEAPPIKGAIRTAPEVYKAGASERVIWKTPEGQVVQVNEGPVGHWSQQADPLDQWIEGPLTKYVKTRMASPEDEVRRLAEQGVLHYDPTGVMGARNVVHPTGDEVTKVGVSPNAQMWENISDRFVYPELAGNVSNPKKRAENPWIEKLKAEAPQTPVYSKSSLSNANDLGFNHLIDELSNALDPNSGLPPHLQLTPEAVKQMSMEKAVRRVADINAHRAAQQAAANAELANKAMMVREYTDPALPNPKGLRWVELRQNLPEKPTGDITDEKLLPWEEAKRQSAQELERQLKYEGDTMGHCVGGYCPDVLEGRSRIFSLRDAKGEPHVTVEVGKKGSYDEDGFHDFAEANGFDLDVDGVGELAMKAYNKSLEKTQPRIIQIKGKQNRKPNDEYLPFVQDFVRNSPLGGSWGDVGDLGNTGLSKISGSSYIPYTQKSLPEGFYNDAELKAAAKEAGLDDDQITNWLFNIEKNRRPYAQGGTVRQPIRPGDETMTTGTRGFTALPGQFQGIIAAIEQELANATA